MVICVGEFVQSSDSNDDSDIDSTFDMDEIVGNVETDIDQVLSNQKEQISHDVDNNTYVFSHDKMAEKDRQFSLLKAKYRNEIVTKINKINHDMTDLRNKGYLVPVVMHRRQYRLQILRTEMNIKIKRRFFLCTFKCEQQTELFCIGIHKNDSNDSHFLKILNKNNRFASQSSQNQIIHGLTVYPYI